MLTDLTKLYTDDLKFGGELYDVLDLKIQVFKNLCRKAGIPARGYHEAYDTMLKGKAHDFYYQHIDQKGYTFLEMVARTRTYIHTPENYQLYLNEWRSTMLKDVIAANPERDIAWCLESVITKLQKVHEGLKHNYNSSEGILAGQLIHACQGVRACDHVLTRLAGTFEGMVIVGCLIAARPLVAEGGAGIVGSTGAVGGCRVYRAFGGVGRPGSLGVTALVDAYSAA
jgi:hypothetical protein